jgi:hypothetical protein
MTKRMHWDTAAKRAKVGGEHHTSKQIIPINIDQTFWKAWKDDPQAMREAGYRVKKDDRSGRWIAWIER